MESDNSKTRHQKPSPSSSKSTTSPPRKENSSLSRSPSVTFQQSRSPLPSSNDTFRISSAQESLLLELQQKLKDYETKIAELEKENQRIVSHNTSINEEHSQETARLKRNIKQLEQESEQFQARNQNSKNIDSVIIDIYLQMKDRTSYDEDDDDDNDNPSESRGNLLLSNPLPMSWIDRERELLARENPLVVLDLLRAELKTLADFKSDFENELKGQIRKKKSNIEQQNQNMGELIKDLEREIEDLKKDKLVILEQGKISVNDKLKIQKEKTELQDKFEHDIKRFKLEVDRVTRENDTLQSILTEKERSIREKDTLIEKLSGAEESAEVLRSKHKSDIQKLETHHQRELQKKQQELDQLRDSIPVNPIVRSRPSTNQSYRSTISNLSNQTRLSTSSVNTTANLNSKLETDSLLKETVLKLERANRLLEKEKEITQKQEGEVRRAKAVTHEAEKKIAQLKKKLKVERLVKVTRPVHMEELAESHGTGEHSHTHSYIEVYKKMLKEKEKELSLVNAKLSRMLTVWNRGQLTKKTSWAEKNLVMNELETLRGEVKRLQVNGPASSTSSGSTSTYSPIRARKSTGNDVHVSVWMRNIPRFNADGSVYEGKDDYDDDNGGDDRDNGGSYPYNDDDSSEEDDMESGRPSTAPSFSSFNPRTKSLNTSWSPIPGLKTKKRSGGSGVILPSRSLTSSSSSENNRKKPLSFISTVDLQSLK